MNEMELEYKDRQIWEMQQELDRREAKIQALERDREEWEVKTERLRRLAAKVRTLASDHTELQQVLDEMAKED